MAAAPPDGPFDGGQPRDGQQPTNGHRAFTGCGPAADGDLTWLVDDRDGIVLVRLAGVLDLSTEFCLPLAADDALADAPPALVLDLAGVEFCDARGLSALLLFRRRVQDAGASVTFVGARPLVRRVFELVGQGSLVAAPPDPS
jgi:anti-anti-sigma factor